MLRGCRDTRFQQNRKLNGRHEAEHQLLILAWKETHRTSKRTELASPQTHQINLRRVSGDQDPTPPSIIGPSRVRERYMLMIVNEASNDPTRVPGTYDLGSSMPGRAR